VNGQEKMMHVPIAKKHPSQPLHAFMGFERITIIMTIFHGNIFHTRHFKSTANKGTTFGK